MMTSITMTPAENITNVMSHRLVNHQLWSFRITTPTRHTALPEFRQQFIRDASYSTYTFIGIILLTVVKT